MCGRGPAGNAGSGTRGAGHSRHPCTSWSSSSDASQTPFEKGPKTSCGSRATARASWRRRCAGDAEHVPDRRVVVTGHRDVVADGVVGGAAAGGVERGVLGREPPQRHLVSAPERVQRAGQVAEEGVAEGRVLDELGEDRRGHPVAHPEAVLVAAAPDQRIGGQAPVEGADRPQDSRTGACAAAERPPGMPQRDGLLGLERVERLVVRAVEHRRAHHRRVVQGEGLGGVRAVRVAVQVDPTHAKAAQDRGQVVADRRAAVGPGPRAQLARARRRRHARSCRRRSGAPGSRSRSSCRCRAGPSRSGRASGAALPAGRGSCRRSRSSRSRGRPRTRPAAPPRARRGRCGGRRESARSAAGQRQGATRRAAPGSSRTRRAGSHRRARSGRSARPRRRRPRQGAA